jgi:hypothetical protein
MDQMENGQAGQCFIDRPLFARSSFKSKTSTHQAVLGPDGVLEAAAPAFLQLAQIRLGVLLHCNTNETIESNRIESI